jgi:hypothetical protein
MHCVNSLRVKWLSRKENELLFRDFGLGGGFFGVFVGFDGVFMSLLRELMGGKMVPFAMGCSCGCVSMCGEIVVFGGAVVWALGHLSSPIQLDAKGSIRAWAA